MFYKCLKIIDREEWVILRGIIATIRRMDEFYDFKEHVKQLVDLGVRIFRFNLSKFDGEIQEQFIKDVEYIRSTYKKEKIGVMLDIPYPYRKVRINIKKPIDIKRGDSFQLEYSKTISDMRNVIGIDVKNIEYDVGSEIIYSNGEGAFVVEQKNEQGGYFIKALNDFQIKNRKSFNDRIINEGFDFSILNRIVPEYIALSFVENEEQVLHIKKIIQNPQCKIIAKIESLEGVRNLTQIITASEGILLARGDLGLQVKIEDFVRIEKYICCITKKEKKHLIAATGIGDSLINNYIPSRADLSDINFLKEQAVDYIIISVGQSVSKNADRIIVALQQLIR